MKLRSRSSSSGRARVRRLAHVVGAVAAFLLWLIYLSPTSLGGPLSLIWVNGTSMEPGLHTGDLAIMFERESYGIGEVVAFGVPEGGTVIHRIVDEVDGNYVFRGDNRQFDDPWVLDGAHVRGAQVFSIPKAATVVSYLAHPAVMGLLVGALVLLSFLSKGAESTVPSRTGELAWGPVTRGVMPSLLPTPRRLCRQRRARTAIDVYRLELEEFRRWPVVGS